MGIPTGFADHVIPPHGPVAGEDILIDAGEHVMHAGTRVGRGRPFIKHEPRAVGMAFRLFFGDVMCFPECQDFFFQLGEGDIRRHAFKHGAPPFEGLNIGLKTKPPAPGTGGCRRTHPAVPPWFRRPRAFGSFPGRPRGGVGAYPGARITAGAPGFPTGGLMAPLGSRLRRDIGNPTGTRLAPAPGALNRGRASDVSPSPPFPAGCPYFATSPP